MKIGGGEARLPLYGELWRFRFLGIEANGNHNVLIRDC